MAANKIRTILSLFDYSGRWSQPYRDAGYNVIQVDIKLGSDVFDPALFKLPAVHGILAAPPCTDFSGSGAQYWPAKDADGRTAASLTLVHQTLALVAYHQPKFWCLENPVGRLTTLLPSLGKWKMHFNPCDYAGYSPDPESDSYTKRTCLWGNFNIPIKHPRESIRTTSQGSWVQKLGGSSERTKELRSMTPLGFSKAFYLSNP